MGDVDFVELGAKIGIHFVPFLFALCFHEFAHGLVAKLLGDNTAERLGRLNLNPFSHSDLYGTWIFPLTAIIFNSPMGFFGWAKPVPVDSRNLKKPMRDMFWIALAGPMSNVLLAAVAAVALGVAKVHAPEQHWELIKMFLMSFLFTNVALALFNLIPLGPLDGAKVIAPFLPIRWNMWLDRHQTQLSMFLFLLLILGGGIFMIPVNIVGTEFLEFADFISGRIA